jgi:predicted dehydrogenase
MIRFGIAGFGLHAAGNLVPGFRLAKKCRPAALSRRHLDAARASAAEHRIPLAFDSLADLCGSPEVDAVLVATPNAFHHRDVLTALSMGKPVLCEKPMGLRAAECREMVAAAADRQLTLGVAQVFRFDESAMAFREKLLAGAIGPLRLARAEFLYPAANSTRAWIADPRIAGGGPICDVGVHCIDTLRFVLNDEVACVRAAASGEHHSGGVESTAILTLEFRRGALATVLVSTRAPYRRVLDLVGEQGRLLASDEPAEDAPRPGFKRFLPYARLLDGFAQAIEQRTPFPIPGEEGLQNQLVLDAAYRSLETGRAESPGEF